MAWLAGAAIVGALATTYSAYNSAQQGKANAKQQQQANLTNYLLNRQGQEEQQYQANQSRLDQQSIYNRQAEDNALERRMILQQSGSDRRNAILQGADNRISAMEQQAGARSDAIDQLTTGRLDAIQSRADVRKQADADRRVALSGSVDSRGNRVEYVEGIGWVERPTYETRRLISASDSEELLRNTVDANRTRIGRENNFNRRLEEGSLADALMRRINSSTGTASDTEARMLSAGVASSVADDQGARDAINNALVRRGAGGVVADMGTNGNQARTLAAIAAARLNAPSAARQEEQGRQGGAINAYNAMASRASQVDDAGFTPSTLDQQGDANRRASQGVAPQGLGSALSAIANSGQAFQQANNNNAVAAANGMNLVQAAGQNDLVSRQMNALALSGTRTPSMGANPAMYQRQQLQAPNLMMPADQTATALGGFTSLLMNAQNNPLVKRLTNWMDSSSPTTVSGNGLSSMPYSSFYGDNNAPTDASIRIGRASSSNSW